MSRGENKVTWNYRVAHRPGSAVPSYGIYEVIETESECWLSKGELLILADKLASECFKQARVLNAKKIKNIDYKDLNTFKP